MNKKVINILFISHLFPPVGGAGVQRSSKFVKYLPEFGFNPIVITSAVAGSNKWTPADSSLETDLNEETRIYRLPNEPAFQVTSNTKENPTRTAALLKLADQAINTHKISLVYVSLSPFGDLAAAKLIGRKHSLPVVADLRDPWAFDEFQSYRSFLHRYKEKSAMNRALKDLDFVIMNTPTSANLVKNQLKDLNTNRIEWITNGYDKEDFDTKKTVQVLDTTKFNIVHTGTFHTEYAIRQNKNRLINLLLGRTHRGINVSGRTPIYLFQAIQNIRKNRPLIGNRIQVTLAGVSNNEEKELSRQYGLNDITSITGYIDHSKSINFLKSADLLFLPLHNLPKSDLSSIVPGKAYEYLASGKPILAALPNGDAKSFIDSAGTGLFCDPTDVSSIENRIIEAFEAWQCESTPLKPNLRFIQQFERRNLTKRLAEVFRRSLETT